MAFEAAHQLHQQGREVKGIILIDSPYPVNHEPLPDEVIAHVSKAGSSATRQRVAQQFQANAALLAEYQAPQSSHPFKKVVMLRSRDTFDCERLCGVHYPWLSDQNMRSRAVEAWKVLIGHDTKVLEIPGNHFEAFTMQNVSLPHYLVDENKILMWMFGRFQKPPSGLRRLWLGLMAIRMRCCVFGLALFSNALAWRNSVLGSESSSGVKPNVARKRCLKKVCYRF